ncbi:MAG: phage replisome organizer N-terminal domain-containing protein, partial [Caldisericia bacterium]|nr:phage replisome organizer N-terminal domain-containing protein [Caldisericia bacterium]
KRIDWLKLSTGIFEDEKIILLLSMRDGEKIIIFFLRLLTISAKQNQNGKISFSESVPYSVKNLAKICQISVKKCEDFLKILEKFQIIFTELLKNNEKKLEKNHENKFIFITNWEKHQSTDRLDKIRQQQSERAKRYREKQQESNVTITLPSRDDHATEVEVELDKELKNIQKDSTYKNSQKLIDPLIRNSERSKDPKPKAKNKDPKNLKKVESKKPLDSSSSVDTVDKITKSEEPNQKKFITDVKIILKNLNDITGCRFRLTDSFKKSVIGRLKDGYTVDDFTVLIREKTKEWKGTEFEKYLRPTTLFRPSKFDEYLNQAYCKKTNQPPKGGISRFEGRN